LIEPAAAPFVRSDRQGPARVLLAVEEASIATAVVCSPTSGALVLGSTQSEAGIDVARCSAAGLEICRRRSGGGAIVVRPGAQIWIDVFVPRRHRRFDDDVLASFGWLGAAWRDALAAALEEPIASLEVVGGRRTVSTKWSRTICFAGLGAGEVTLRGRKVVGISQRRDRSGAWFHSMAMLDFDPGELPGLLGLPESDQDEAAALSATSAVTVPGGHAVAPEVTSAVLERLS
jgi:lipoate-protein ligase A